jgi:hypothetical protein
VNESGLRPREYRVCRNIRRTGTIAPNQGQARNVLTPAKFFATAMSRIAIQEMRIQLPTGASLADVLDE